LACKDKCQFLLLTLQMSQENSAHIFQKGHVGINLD